MTHQSIAQSLNQPDFYYEGYFVKEGAYDDETRYSPATLQSLLASANGKINNNTTDSWVIDNILTIKIHLENIQLI